jgi:hypothetical protein
LHTGAGGPAFSIAPPATQAKGALPGGYNAVAGFNALGFGGGGSSSDDDDSSSAAPSSPASGGSDSEASAKSGSTDGDATSTESDYASSDDGSTAGDGTRHSAAAAAGTGGLAAGKALTPGAAARARRKAEKEKLREEVARANLVVGNPEASSGAWGYPFTGPRARTLFISRRSRRHRLMRWHLAAALSSGGADGSGVNGDQDGTGPLTLAAVGSTDDTGPVFSAGSGFRLDKRAFWDSLLPGSGATSGWEELTGPNDPLVLSGRYTVAKQGGAELLVTLRAYNRLGLKAGPITGSGGMSLVAADPSGLSTALG